MTLNRLLFGLGGLAAVLALAHPSNAQTSGNTAIAYPCTQGLSDNATPQQRLDCLNDIRDQALGISRPLGRLFDRLDPLIANEALVVAAEKDDQQPDPEPQPDPGPVPAPVPTPAPAPAPQPIGDYPFYMPMGDLLPFKHERLVLCEESNAVGDEVFADGLGWYANGQGYSQGGVHHTFEARDDNGQPCVYNFAPSLPRPGGGGNAWESGSQFRLDSSEPGTRVRFSTDDEWATVTLNAGPNDGKRIHLEIVDLDLDFTGNVQPSGSVWFQAYPSASSGGLASLVIRNSRITGGKNALFSPSGAIMIFVENSDIGRNLGRNIDQEHSVYLNGTLTAHFRDSLIFGQRASSGAGGHILKAKSAIRILENVTLDNGGGVLDPTNRPLADFSSWGWTWSDGLNLVRRQPSGAYRPALVDIRRDQYFGKRLDLPWPTAEGWTLGMEPGDCDTPMPLSSMYLHVFQNTAVESEIPEDSVFRMNGAVETAFEGIHARTAYDDIIANPRRNRAMLYEAGTVSDAQETTADGWYYLKPAYPTYHCAVEALPAAIADRDTFVAAALAAMNAANGGMIPLN